MAIRDSLRKFLKELAIDVIPLIIATIIIFIGALIYYQSPSDFSSKSSEEMVDLNTKLDLMSADVASLHEENKLLKLRIEELSEGNADLIGFKYNINLIKNNLTSLKNNTKIILESSIYAKLISLDNKISSLEKTFNDTHSADDNYTLLNNRFSNIERAILDDPEKALTLTLLSRDIKDMETREKDARDDLRNDVERLYELIQWLIGLIVAMALAVVGVVVGSHLRK